MREARKKGAENGANRLYQTLVRSRREVVAGNRAGVEDELGVGHKGYELLVTFPYSNAGWVQVFPSENQEKKTLLRKLTTEQKKNGQVLDTQGLAVFLLCKRLRQFDCSDGQ